MVGEVNAGLIEGLKERSKRASKVLQNKKGDAVAACCLKGCNILITLETSTSNIDMGEGISAGCEALGMSERSASGIGGKIAPSGLLLFQMGS